MVTHHLGVVNRAHARVGREGGSVAFGHGREAAVRRLAVGGTVIAYAPRAAFDGEPVQAFVAHATVTGEAPIERDFGGRVGWVREAAYDEVVEAPVRPLLAELSFVRDERPRGVALRRGEIPLASEDPDRIARAMGFRAG